MRLLAVDPSTTAAGWAFWSTDEPILVSYGTITAKGDYLERIASITKQLERVLFDVAPEICVVEQPGSFGRFFKGQVYLLLGTGAAAGVCWAHGGDKVELIAPSKWYPRYIKEDGKRGRIMKKPDCLETLREKWGIRDGMGVKLTEHELMAIGIGEWYVNQMRSEGDAQKQ
jgi:hypothetical protein